MDDIFNKDIWMPELIEILKYQEDEKKLPPEKQYFSQFGFDKLDVPDDCPLTKAMMSELTYRFNLHYRFRMLGAETMEMWQTFLQDKFLDGVHRFERGLAFYANNKALMEDVVGYTEMHVGRSANSGSDAVARIMARTYTGADNLSRTTKVSDSGADRAASSGSSTSSADSDARMADTPDTSININEHYADAVQQTSESGSTSNSDESSVTYGKVTDATTTDKTTYGKGVNDDGTDTTTYGKVNDTTYDVTRLDNGQVIDQVNHAITAWYDLECQFVDSFQGCFLGIFGY